MIESETDCEVAFLRLLDDWCAIFPDGEHIDLELRDVYFPRLLKQMNKQSFVIVVNDVTDVIENFVKLVDDAIVGGMRSSWVSCLQDILSDFIVVGNLIWEECELRTH